MPTPWRPASRTALALAGARQVATDVSRLLRRAGRPRDGAAVRAEYGARWSRQLAAHRGIADLPALVARSSFDGRTLTAMRDGKIYTVPSGEFFRWRAAMLGALFAAHYPLDARITEIGCGAGKNLFALAWRGFADLGGCDLFADAAQAVAGGAAALGLRMEITTFDLLRPDYELPIAQRMRGGIVFTNYVLEQLPGRVETAIGTILRLAPEEVLHIEPSVELGQSRARADRLLSAFHAWACHYATDILAVLARMERAGRVQLLDVRPLGYSPTVFHSPILIRWRPRT